MLTGTNLTYTKEYNLRIVHETIRLYGPLSRAQIARHTDLTPQTVSNLVKNLRGLNLIIEGEKRREGRGAPSITLALNPEGAYSIGLDLDRDHLTGLLVDHAGAVRQRIHHRLLFSPPEEALALMIDTVQGLVERQGLRQDQVCGVGIGVPGPMHAADDGAYVISPKAFAGWHDVPIAARLQKHLHVPVFMENNATAAAMGERWYGAGRHVSTFFYIYFGSGLGGGLIIQGQPYEGFTGNAGELGCLPVIPPGTQAFDGTQPRVGEHFNLPRLYQALQAEGLDVSTPEDLKQLFVEGHPSLLGWIETAAHHLTWLVMAVEYLLDPQAIFVGGRLADEILEALLQRVTERLPALRTGGKPALPAYKVAAAGVDAAALGVAALPIYEFFAPTHRILIKQPDAPARPSLHHAPSTTPRR